MAFDLSEYNDVASRTREFRAKYPEGSLQTEIVPLPDALAGQFIAVKAYAYRTPDDPCPGVDHAWEPVPGKTQFTRESELQNACTAAIGRAIVASLAADTKHMASQDEVRNRTAVQDAPVIPEALVDRVAALPMQAADDALERIAKRSGLPINGLPALRGLPAEWEAYVGGLLDHLEHEQAAEQPTLPVPTQEGDQ